MSNERGLLLKRYTAVVTVYAPDAETAQYTLTTAPIEEGMITQLVEEGFYHPDKRVRGCDLPPPGYFLVEALSKGFRIGEDAEEDAIPFYFAAAIGAVVDIPALVHLVPNGNNWDDAIRRIEPTDTLMWHEGKWIPITEYPPHIPASQ